MAFRFAFLTWVLDTALRASSLPAWDLTFPPYWLEDKPYVPVTKAVFLRGLLNYSSLHCLQPPSPHSCLSCVGKPQFLGWGGEEVRGQVVDIWSLTSGVWERAKVWPTHFKGMLQASSRARRKLLREQSIWNLKDTVQFTRKYLLWTRSLLERLVNF